MEYKAHIYDIHSGRGGEVGVSGQKLTALIELLLLT